MNPLRRAAAGVLTSAARAVGGAELDERRDPTPEDTTTCRHARTLDAARMGKPNAKVCLDCGKEFDR